MNCGGSAASPRTILASNGFGYDAKMEIEIKAGKMAGYSMGAGSNDAGIRIRWRNRSVEGGSALHE